MTKAEKYIHYYNRLNGKTVSIETLKSFYDKVTSIVDRPEVNGYKADLESMKKRIVQGIFSAGTETVVKVECVPIDVTRKRTDLRIRQSPQGDKPKIKRVVVTKEVVKIKEVPPKKMIEELNQMNETITFIQKKLKRRDAKIRALKDFTPKPIENPIVTAPTIDHKSKTVKKKIGSAPPQKPESRQTSLFGFVTSDQTPQKTKGTFTLPGAIGAILGDLQRYKLEIVIAGETHSSKSELGKQIADAFIAHGDDVAWIDWEQGGLESKDTVDSIKRNVAPEHRKKFHVSGTVPKSLSAVKSLTKDFKVIALDSGSKLEEVTNAWIDELREEYPDTVWIIMFQQNTKGGTRGGTSAEFDAPVVLKTYRPDQRDFKKNYAHVFKNRGNKTGQYYLIASKQIVDEEPKKEDPKKMEAPKLDPIVEQQNPVVV